MNKTDAFYYMKFYIKFKYILLLTCLSISIISKASDFEVDGLGYNRLSSNQIKTNNENIISFEDANVKAICVANWDKNDDGELSEDEAAAVTYLGGVFYENTTITSFEEFQFFVGIEDLSSAFRNCSNLKKVLIPSSVKTIGKWAFQNCSALTGTLVIPSSVTSIGESAFEECSGFTGALTIPESVTSIGERAFLGCVGFNGSLSLPNSLTSIGKHAFYGCSGFTGNLTIPESVISIGGWAFQDCSGFSSTLTIPNSVESIGYAAFWGCSNINKVISQILSPIQIDVDVFRGISSDAVLQVPKGTKAQYLNYTGWTKYFKEIIEEGDDITYSLSISATGNGSASYNGMAIRNKTSTFTVNEGASATISFIPDNGYRIKGVKLNSTNVTSNVSNNQYTVSNITANTTLEVEFEAIPITTYTLTIKATGNGSASYNGTAIRGKTSSFTVNEGTKVSISLTPDNGYRIKSVKENDTNVTSYVSNGTYTINSISKNTNVEVEFEAIPPTTYTLSIKATGNGSASYNGTTIRSKTSTFTVNEGASATIMFSPDDGYRIKSVKENDTNVTSYVSNGTYIINSISRNTTVEVEFEAGSNLFTAKTIEGVEMTFKVISEEYKTCQVGIGDINNQAINGGTEGIVTIPEKVINSDNSYEYSVVGIGEYAFYDCDWIEEITIPNSVKKIGSGAFQSCRSLEVVISKIIKPFDIDESVFELFAQQHEVLYVPQGTIDQYLAITNWKKYFNEVRETRTTNLLTITASGNGIITYSGENVRNDSKSFSIPVGESATIKITPDDGCRIKSVKVNDSDRKSEVTTDGTLTINLTGDTKINVEFEAIPITTYTLSIKATGNGSATYDGTAIRGKTSSFTVNEGAKVSILLTPDNGYRIKSVMEDGTDVTSYVSNGKYTINSISRNTTIEVEFEAIPVTAYTLSISATGNGYVAYDGNIVRGKTSSFTVNEGTNATIKFSADEGNRLESVKLNGIDITYDITGNQYVVSNISANTSIEVVFEAIPTYSLDITATGNGSVTYNGTSIRNQSLGFALQEGSSAVISITPDSGYRIASVKVNSKDATSQVANGKLSITNIQQDLNVEVTFEAIPATTCTLSITATGNGVVTYDGKNVRNQTSSFTIAIGTYATILFAADEGYRLKRVTLDGKDVIADVANDQYTTSKLMADAVLLVEFEAVPTYSLTVKSSQYGSVRFGDEVVKNETKTFSVTEGASAVLTFTPDNNGHLQSVTLNGTDITQQLSNGQYTISDIRANQDVEAVFTEDATKVTYEGVAYSVTSYSNQTVVVAAGNYSNVLVVPASFTVGGITWKVEGVAEGALMDNKGLAAVVWKPALKFTEKVSNPNLLLYVKQAQFASPDIQNVILGDMDNGETLLADNITLVEADNDNDFYCPLTFIAKHISYEHNYSMISGHKSCQGWETLVLPFDVSMMVSPKGRELVPYTSWEHGSNLRPYWLYELTTEGWKAANGIKANTPYIISMPNNEAYESSYNITGDIQFVGYNVQVVASDKITNGQYGNKRLVANYRNQKANNGIYALNVNNRWNNNTDTSVEGSAFIRGLRQVRPFEAYMALEGGNAGIRAIPVFGNETTGIMTLPTTGLEDADAIYNLNGQRVNSMSRGIYIQNGRKVVKKK